VSDDVVSRRVRPLAARHHNKAFPPLAHATHEDFAYVWRLIAEGKRAALRDDEESAACDSETDSPE
jgi:hypothetical protein